MAQGPPQTPTCWFCQTRLPDRDCASEWEMHRETGAKTDDGVTSIAKSDWEPTTVPVPRCAQCKRAHDRRERFVEKGWKVGLLFGVVFVAVFLLLGYRGIPLLTVGDSVLIWRPPLILVPVIVFACAIVGGLVGWLFGKSSLPPGIRDQSAATLHPNIKSMEAQGWKIGAKPV
jgi:hypothetical protein